MDPITLLLPCIVALFGLGADEKVWECGERCACTGTGDRWAAAAAAKAVAAASISGSIAFFRVCLPPTFDAKRCAAAVARAGGDEAASSPSSNLTTTKTTPANGTVDDSTNRTVADIGERRNSITSTGRQQQEDSAETLNAALARAINATAKDEAELRGLQEQLRTTIRRRADLSVALRRARADVARANETLEAVSKALAVAHEEEQEGRTATEKARADLKAVEERATQARKEATDLEVELDDAIVRLSNTTADIDRVNRTLTEKLEAVGRSADLLQEVETRAVQIPEWEKEEREISAKADEIAKRADKARNKVNTSQDRLDDTLEELEVLERELAATERELEHAVNNKTATEDELRARNKSLTEAMEEADRVLSTVCNMEWLEANQSSRQEYLARRLETLVAAADSTRASIQGLEQSVARAARRYAFSSETEAGLRRNLTRLQEGDISNKKKIEAICSKQRGGESRNSLFALMHNNVFIFSLQRTFVFGSLPLSAVSPA